MLVKSSTARMLETAANISFNNGKRYSCLERRAACVCLTNGHMVQGGFDGSRIHSFDRCNENEMHSSKQCGYICVTMSNVCSESKMDVLSIRITRKVSTEI